MKNGKSIAVALVLLPTLAVASPGSKPQKFPAFVRFRLAGGNLMDKDNFYEKYDAKERYYLISTGDCDGTVRTLILTPSPSSSGMGDDDRYFAEKSLKRVTLPHLRNGKGVNIGDTPQQVRKKLGVGPHRAWAKKDSKARVWAYYSKRHSYAAEYTFRKGSLWSIIYTIGDGCE